MTGIKENYNRDLGSEKANETKQRLVQVHAFIF